MIADPFLTFQHSPFSSHQHPREEVTGAESKRWGRGGDMLGDPSPRQHHPQSHNMRGEKEEEGERARDLAACWERHCNENSCQERLQIPVPPPCPSMRQDGRSSRCSSQRMVTIRGAPMV